MMSTESPPGRRVTLRDIARRLDVSHATVSRALNAAPDAFISDRTRERVRKTAQEMGYRPNQSARSLATGRTGLFALWLWTERMQGAYHATVAQLLHEAARNGGRQLLIDPLSRTPDDGIPEVAFDRWHVDGIVAWESGPAIEALLQGGAPSPVPIVSVGSFHLLAGVDRVEIDLRKGVEDALDHLLAGGRRRIVYVADDMRSRPDDLRYRTYVERVTAAGFAPEFLDVQPTRRAARTAMREFIERQGVPDALFCHNDDLAIGAYRGLCDLGVRVPDDVAIVGCDGVENGEYLEVPITTVAQPVSEACELACRFLERRVEDPSLALQSAVLEATLVVRESTLMPS